VVAFLLLAMPPFARAQYFGQNKVQYEDFDFKVLSTDHFEIYFYPEEEEAVRVAAVMAERWYGRLSSLLDHQLRGIQPLVLYASHPHFQQTNVVGGPLSEGTGGVTESLKRRIVMPFAGPLGETDHVLGHELVHAFQYDVTSQNRTSAAAAYRLPLWFMEGMAEYLSQGPVDVLTATWLRQAVLDGRLPAIEDLNDPRYFPYRFGQALWAYFAGRFGDEAVGVALKAAAGGASAIEALEYVAGVDHHRLSEDWHRSIHETYGPLLRSPVTAAAYGRELVSDERNGGTVNVAPSLSPGGDRFMFLSERDLFSIDMFLADARTGEVLESVVETATDPHFDTLQFIQSSGSWSPEGDAFVFAGVKKGQPVVTFISVPSGERTLEIEYPEIGEILNPRWSPDGRRVAFSANVSGLTDLYVLDISSRTTRRLTDDLFADLQPDWSPDGRGILFVTDRFSSRAEALHWGHYELAVLDLATGAITGVKLFGAADHWDPQWKGSGIYFRSDYSGRMNIYRYDVASGGIFEVTSLSTGVTGITKLSPAFTLTPSGDRMLFTVREDDEYRIYAVDRPIAGRRLRLGADNGGSGGEPAIWAVLPPVPRSPSVVDSWFREPLFGVPPALRTQVRDYEVDFDLDFVGQPFVVAGSNRFGTGLGGGVSFLWSDMLNEHQIGLQIETMGDIENIAAIAGYENRASHWFWGASVSRIPFVTGGYNSGVAEIDGQPAGFEELIEVRQTSHRFGGYVAYPFHRAQRLEFSTGITHYGYSQTADIFAVSLETGEILVDEMIDLPTPDDLNIVDTSAALVYDTAILGPTSPLAGTRYRFEAGANYGSREFATALADFRHYFLPARPLTVAGRLLHLGRYGGQSDDPGLSQLFLGYPHYVRGYMSGSFTAEECRADGGCPVYERLFGSRILVANLELRVPLWSALGAEPWSGPIPVEIALFGDAGYAWDQDVSPDVFGGDREPATSAGVALRVAVQQYLVFEFDFVRPFERTEKGWIFEFSLQRGF
jgi:hypothetical protein